MPQLILVVDDEATTREMLRFSLSEAGYRVMTAENGQDAIAICKQDAPDLLILDIMMPVMDGWEVCKRLRTYSDTAAIPIMMLSSKCEETDKVQGLTIGADDYMTKPFGIQELLARVMALLRRTVMPSEEVLHVLEEGGLTIDASRFRAVVFGRNVDLTLKEFELLRLLARNKGKVLSREQLLEQVWGYEYLGETRTVDVHVRHIRQKVGEAWIETVRGVGYRFTQRPEDIRE